MSTGTADISPLPRYRILTTPHPGLSVVSVKYVVNRALMAVAWTLSLAGPVASVLTGVSSSMEVGLENPSRRSDSFQRPFHIRAPDSDACHAGECLDGTPEYVRHSGSPLGPELLRAHGPYFLGSHRNRSNCDLGWLRQRSSLDLVCSVFHHMGVGIPRLRISGVPLEEHAPYRAMAAARSKVPRAPARICRVCRDVRPHVACFGPSGENVHSGSEGSPEETLWVPEILSRFFQKF